MTDFEDLQQEVAPFVEETLEYEDIKNFKITVTGKSEKGDGYIGDIIFVQVAGLNKLCENVELNLVLKMGKKNKIFREKYGVRNIYLREIYIYDKIFPAFKKFQQDKKIKNMFDSIPKCYRTIVLDDMEVLVLENLKKQGYELHDRQVTLNSDHIRLVLDNYAKFHAISFAMKDQNQEEFDNLTADYTPSQRQMYSQEGMVEWYDMRVAQFADMIQETDEELSKLVLKVFDKKLLDLSFKVLDAKVQEAVITHGDCWNNNFMFKYENGDMDTPTAVSILDWQLSCLHSPAMDLSYFLYIVSSEEEVAKFDEFLRFYHSKLSEYIREMGSEPEKLFPFSTLINHFNKYSIYGIAFLISTLEMMLTSKEDAISLDDFDHTMEITEEALREWTNKIKAKNHNSYRDRCIAAVGHYLKNVIKVCD